MNGLPGGARADRRLGVSRPPKLKAAEGDVLNVSSEARANEILCKPNGGTR